MQMNQGPSNEILIVDQIDHDQTNVDRPISIREDPEEDKNSSSSEEQNNSRDYGDDDKNLRD